MATTTASMCSHDDPVTQEEEGHPLLPNELAAIRRRSVGRPTPQMEYDNIRLLEHIAYQSDLLERTRLERDNLRDELAARKADPDDLTDEQILAYARSLPEGAIGRITCAVALGLTYQTRDPNAVGKARQSVRKGIRSR